MPASDDSARPRPLGFQPSLAGLRAVAITVVVADHLVSSFAPTHTRLFAGGILGVDVFFVLSGFLITSLLLEQHDRDGRIHPIRFYRNRALRLFPPVVVMLVCWDLLAGLSHSNSAHSLLFENGAVLTYSVNWFTAYGRFLGFGIYQTWSLAIEEQFYLVWPWAILLAVHRRWSPRKLATVLVTAIVVVVAWRAHMWLRDPNFVAVYYRTDTRADSLLVGALACVAWRAGWITPGRLRWATAPLLLALLVLTQTTSVHSGGYYLGGFTVVAFGAAVLVLSVVDGEHRTARLLASRPAVYLGEISYSLYLMHVLIIFGVARYVHADVPVRAALALSLSLLAAAAVNTLLEQPFRHLRRRLAQPQPEPHAEPHIESHDDRVISLVDTTSPSIDLTTDVDSTQATQPS